MTAKERLSTHDREIADIRAISKRTEQIIPKHAANYARESAEMWLLLGKLAKGTEAAQKETRELRTLIRALLDSPRATNGHRKREKGS